MRVDETTRPAVRASETTGATRAHARAANSRRLRFSAPTLLAAVLGLAYVIVAPRSVDLAAQLLRVKLFGAEGFGLWNNWWYAGHNLPGYSVLFPPLGWLLTPQIVAATAATATAAAFTMLAYDVRGEDAWVAALWFAAGTATNLLSGRLTYALGLLGATATALALERRRPVTASTLAILTALASPVAALFAALAGAAVAASAATRRQRREAVPGLAVAVAALAPVALLAIVFPEGGTEPFALSALWPIPLIAVALLLTAPPSMRALKAGLVLYALGCILAYVVATPVGGNAPRLGALLAGPLAALLWWRRRMKWLLIVALPLLYLQWQAAVRDVTTATGDASTQAGYYRSLLAFLERQPGPPFRIEIPFTRAHWEAYEVAPQFPLARGWERQLDEKYNRLFYAGRLTPQRYDTWLHQVAVRFVALPDAPLDASARQEAALIERGLPFLKLVLRTRHWRVYAVAHATPIVQGAAVLTAWGPNSVSMQALRPGRALIHIHFSPYWRLEGPAGCVAPAGAFTQVSFTRAGRARLVIDFALDRIAARSPRCS